MRQIGCEEPRWARMQRMQASCWIYSAAGSALSAHENKAAPAAAHFFPAGRRSGIWESPSVQFLDPARRGVARVHFIRGYSLVSWLFRDQLTGACPSTTRSSGQCAGSARSDQSDVCLLPRACSRHTPVRTHMISMILTRRGRGQVTRGRWLIGPVSA